MMSARRCKVAKLMAILGLALLYAVISGVRNSKASASNNTSAVSPVAREPEPRSNEQSAGQPATTHVGSPGRLWGETAEEAARKSAGCLDCHTGIEDMHSGAINLGCVDCHGGNPECRLPSGAQRGSAAYQETEDRAHVHPR